MVRISKQSERRAQSPRKRQHSSTEKTGTVSDNLPLGFKEKKNAVEGELAATMYIAKIK